MIEYNAMDTPTMQLRRDHDVILKILAAMDALRSILVTVKSSKSDDHDHDNDHDNDNDDGIVAIIKDTIDFVKNFTDRCHHGKEEDVLFPALNSAGIPKEEGPIAVMLREHKQGREIIESMESALEEYEQNGNLDYNHIIKGIEGYILLMYNHIMKENNILFNIADTILYDKGKDINDAYTKVEYETIESKYEHYKRLAESLTDRIKTLR